MCFVFINGKGSDRACSEILTMNVESSCDIRLKWPYRLLISGSSGLGKTTLVVRMLKNWTHCMDRKPKFIHIFFHHMQPLYTEIKHKSPCPVIFHTEPPTEDFVTDKGALILFDDLQGDKKVVDVIREFFTRRSHHDDLSICYICQSLFEKHPAHRIISLNTTYMIIFSSPRDQSQIMNLSKQIYPGADNLLVSVSSAIVRDSGMRGSYLVIDLSPDTPENYRLRNTLFPESDFPNAFAYVRV